MWPRRFFCGRYFAPRYFPQSHGSAPVFAGLMPEQIGLQHMVNFFSLFWGLILAEVLRHV